jgi:arsenate reductase
VTDGSESVVLTPRQLEEALASVSAHFMPARPYNVLFLCTGNSARSIIAETLLNAMGGDRFRAFSAGTQPAGNVNPHVAEYLASVGLGVADARSKSWDEFAQADAPHMDLIITLCDNAAGEASPAWPGVPATAHWSAPDPAAVTEPERAHRVVRDVFLLMHRRIELLLALPQDVLGRMVLQAEARGIGAAGSRILPRLMD